MGFRRWGEGEDATRVTLPMQVGRRAERAVTKSLRVQIKN